MTAIPRPIVMAGRVALVVALASASGFNPSADVGDRHQRQALETAIDAAARARMAHVSTIVDTWRQLVRAEESLALTDVSRLTAEAEEEQVRYAHLVREELALRNQLALLDDASPR